MSKMIFWTVRYTNTQIQIRKYTNTQIQHMTKWPKYPTYAIFLNSWWFKDVKNDNPKYSDPRYTVDFCTVPPGLYFNLFCTKMFQRHGGCCHNLHLHCNTKPFAFTFVLHCNFSAISICNNTLTCSAPKCFGGMGAVVTRRHHWCGR